VFRKLNPVPPPIEILVNDQLLPVDPADSLAAALLSAGFVSFGKSAVAGRPRGPYCLIGHCFECRVEIDGQPNRQACLTPVAPGMRVRTSGN
jgi:hypothetical protein